MAIKIEKDRVVKLAYRLLDGDGRLLEEKTPESPYEYLQGHSQIILPVERLLEGKTPGFQAEIQVAPGEAYGEYEPSLVADLPRAQFPKDVEIAAGMKFNTVGPNGKTIVVRVIEADDETVTIDGNHPLAGLELIFDLRVLDVREASESEIEAGRPGVLSNAGSGNSDSFH